MIEEDLVAEVRSVIDETAAAGQQMPVAWIVQKIMARHPSPADWVGLARDLTEHACRKTLRKMVRKYLGFADDPADSDEPIYSAADYRRQAEQIQRQADELHRYFELRRNRGEAADER